MIAYIIIALLTFGAGFMLGLGLGGLMSNTARDDEYHEGYVAGSRPTSAMTGDTTTLAGPITLQELEDVRDYWYVKGKGKEL